MIKSSNSLSAEWLFGREIPNIYHQVISIPDCSTSRLFVRLRTKVYFIMRIVASCEVSLSEFPVNLLILFGSSSGVVSRAGLAMLRIIERLGLGPAPTSKILVPLEIGPACTDLYRSL